ncbi:quinohemoprotein amine dehydrogenase subunit beta [Motiliproteus sp. MSK22-1]|uniref:quinohemoprotein amine dehydrogenase subunit beta n=1 Tax=Motiliproteus sp. MSK22-1 TaxID=1897630 RepID=UPI0009766171|nr:quinohemoprotein amine dehydrogenase subunit beta [Motiliproteus sp. MSK22-1]OMH29055.1 quinohemoprotein amine dehydrogenase subunit beta [Motiliproteus sp. MSK22-1]
MNQSNLIEKRRLGLVLAGALAISVLASGCSSTQHHADASGSVSGTESAKGESHEYLLTVTRPNNLHVIDMESHHITRSCDIPGSFGGQISLSPDNRTAYILSNGMENVYGLNIETCEQVFSAIQSTADVKVKTFVSIAVSSDGAELYTVQNPVRRLKDEFKVMSPVLAVFNTEDGLNARPVRTFPVDRRITTIAAAANGEVFLGGGDLKAINPKTGEIRMVSALQSEDRPRWLTPDAFAMFNLGEQANEYILPYVTAEFADDTMNFETAAWWWGMNRVDLATGKNQRMEFAPFEFIIFNLVADPNDKNIVYGAFNTISKHDVKNKKVLGVKDLDHTYYNINISGDGQRLYIGGTSSDISIHDHESLEKIGSIQLPGDMSTADLRVARLPH